MSRKIEIMQKTSVQKPMGFFESAKNLSESVEIVKLRYCQQDFSLRYSMTRKRTDRLFATPSSFIFIPYFA